MRNIKWNVKVTQNLLQKDSSPAVKNSSDDDHRRRVRKQFIEMIQRNEAVAPQVTENDLHQCVYLKN